MMRNAVCAIALLDVLDFRIEDLFSVERVSVVLICEVLRKRRWTPLGHS